VKNRLPSDWLHRTPQQLAELGKFQKLDWSLADEHAVSIFVKRDDLLGVSANHNDSSQAFTGNKARKLHYYLENDFPEISTLVSYGSAQSNMLFSLSELAKIKGWECRFYTDHIARHLRDQPRGNYAKALENGVDIVSLREGFPNGCGKILQRYVEEDILPSSENTLFIPEGGRQAESEIGIRLLADEIAQWVKDHDIENPKVFLPSGTGTTAFFLQKHLPFEVLTCACVGSAEYLLGQFSGLGEISRLPRILPTLHPDSGASKKYHFGKLYPEHYATWMALKQETGIRFELLYDPLGWACATDYVQSNPEVSLIYLHQGGLLGNETMIARYQRHA